MHIPEQLRMRASFIDRAGPYLASTTQARRGYVWRGAALGLAVAVVARIWMRSLTGEEPKLSVGGTGFILLVFAALGACAGLAFAWRRLASRRRMLVQRGVGLAPLLLMGPFIVFFVPGSLVALTLAHRGWRRWGRRALFTVAALFAAFIELILISRGGVAGPVSALLYPPLAYVMLLTNRIVFEPRRIADGGASPAPDPYEPWMGWSYGT